MAKKKRRAPAPAAAKALPKEQPRSFLWPILFLALALRLVYLKLSGPSPFYEPLLLDSKYYHDWALRVAGGDFGKGVFYGLPLYPFFLGCVYKLTHASLLAAKWAQLLLGLVTVYFVYRITEKLADQKTAIVSGFLAACYGPFIFHEGIFIPEALGAPLYAAAFYKALEFLEAPSQKKGVWLGVLFGLCTLTKAGILIFVLAFLGSFFWKAPKTRKPALYCLLAFLLTLAPVTAHNYFRGKDFVWLTSHSGFNFYIGNNERAEGVFAAPAGTGNNPEAQIEDSKAIAEQALGRELKPSEVSKYWSEKARDFIRTHPARFIELCARKLALFFDAREISDVDDYQFSALFNPFLKIPWPNFSFVGPLFFLGLVLGYRSLRHRATLLLWIGGYLAGMMAFFVNARYRLPLLSALIPVAAVGAIRFFEDFMEWRLRSLLISAAVLLAAFGFTRLELVGTNYSRDYVNAADAWVLKDNTEKAIPLYQKAMELDPESPKAPLGLAVALTKASRPEEAKDYYLKCLALDPNNSQAHNNLGLWYDKNGDAREAERHFLEAIRLKPYLPQAHNNLGMSYGKRGEYAGAAAEFERAIALNPSNARFYTNLGLIRYQMGDKEKARDLWEKALAVDPRFEEARRALELLKAR